jgi:uncharacterized protein YeaO (DUF488 family)
VAREAAGAGMRRGALKVKRIYERPGPGDGLRVLVDRLWPRGLSKDEAATDLWLKEAAPSPMLRRWYGHDPRRWKRFKDKYRAELAGQPEVLELINDLRRRGPVTLLFDAHDEAQNNAVVLREVLDNEGEKR